MDEQIQDVSTDTVGAADSTAADSSTAQQTAGDSQGGVNATAEAQTSTQEGQQAEIDPLQDVPTVEELTKLAEQKIPHAAALARLRPAYEGLKTQLSEYQSLEPWKQVATTIGDPALAQSAHELVSAIHTPSQDFQNYPGGYDPTPFLQQIDEQSPGTAATMFSALLRFPDVDPQGGRSTVVREFLRDIGLDPDRMQDYREIDKLRASSGVVTAEDLAKVPESYRDAFKGMSQRAQDEVLDLLDDSPVFAEEILRNAERARASERFEQEQKDREAQAQRQQETEMRQRIESSVQNDITAEVKSLSDSIHQSLSSQWKPSADDTQNSLEYAKILSTIATLQNPAYRFVAEQALKAVGVDLTGFDELANRWLERRSAYVTFNETGDKWQAQRALSDATLARQQMLVKLNDFALRLAKAGGDRLQSAASQTAQSLAAASGRFVPNGNSNGAQGGFQNPYAQNPHPVGTQEYYAFNRNIDKQYKLDNASVFGN
jgi:hypothetical protein